MGGLQSVEVLLERGPSSGVVSDLPEERQFPVVASIGDKVFLCGGVNASLQAQSTCLYYTFVHAQWLKMDEEMPSGPLSQSAGVAAYHDFYIIGGSTEDVAPTKCVRRVLKTV